MWAGQERTISLNVTLTLADGDLQVARPGAEPPENTDAAAAAEEGKCAWGGGQGLLSPTGGPCQGSRAFCLPCLPTPITTVAERPQLRDQS